jgi:hypothetical protein
VAAVGPAGLTPASTTRAYPAGAPPYYRGEAPVPGPVAWVAVQIIEMGGTPEDWLPMEELARLADDLNGRLANRSDLRAAAPQAAMPAAGAPEVYLGCSLVGDASGECDQEDAAMVLAVTGPSKAWKQWAAATLADSSADYLLVPTLSVADHWLRQKNLKGSKEIRLGTGYSQPLPWLTALDTPIQVLQVGAVLVDGEGKVTRAGVEGILAVRTELRASVVGAQRMVSGADIERARTAERRDDLPAAPLVWEAALDALVEQMVAAPAGAAR